MTATGCRPATGDADASWPSLSVVLTVRNEAAVLEEAVRAVLAQDYPGPMEVIIAHGPSHDGTAAIVESLAAQHASVRAVVNSSGLTPTGLNLAIAASSGDVVARVDGHSVIPAGYLRRAVSVLQETGADNVGGVQDAVGATPFERAVAAAMSSRFGVGDARFHYGGEPGPADTVYLGTFRRLALERVGGYDESLPRAQDADLNHRIRSSGGLVWFDPTLRVRYHPRGSLSAVAKQYFTSGQWRRRMVAKDLSSLQRRQLVPPLTVIGLVVGVALGLRGRRIGWLAPGSYGAAVTLATRRVGRHLDPHVRRRLPLVFATMHASWGLGFLIGPLRNRGHAAMAKGLRR